MVAGLRANEGYLELEKLYASIPLSSVNDPEVLVYTWYVEVVVCTLSVINSTKCVGNVLKCLFSHRLFLRFNRIYDR